MPKATYTKRPSSRRDGTGKPVVTASTKKKPANKKKTVITKKKPAKNPSKKMTA